jgi:hypothetical protein
MVFDANNNEIQRIDSYWFNGWIQTLKYDYTVDANGNRTQQIQAAYDTAATQWTERSKTDYAFDANNHITQIITSSFNNNTNGWTNSTKYDYSVDNNGNTIQEITASWDIRTNRWVNISKTDKTFNSADRPTTQIYYQWNTTTSAWAKLNKYEFVYDNYNHLTQSTMYAWNWLTGTNWEFEYAFYYNNYYQQGTINIQYLPNNDLVKIFPNPTTNVIQLQPHTTNTPLHFQLVDMQGRVLMEQTIYQQQVIDIHHLAAGVYGYTIHTNNQIQRGKIIKQ